MPHILSTSHKHVSCCIQLTSMSRAWRTDYKMSLILRAFLILIFCLQRWVIFVLLLFIYQKSKHLSQCAQCGDCIFTHIHILQSVCTLWWLHLHTHWYSTVSVHSVVTASSHTLIFYSQCAQCGDCIFLHIDILSQCAQCSDCIFPHIDILQSRLN
jgi:hypothetical protein